MFLLDTHVISELRQGKPQASVAVRQWASGQPSHQLYLSAITLLELELGVQALERKVPPQGAACAPGWRVSSALLQAAYSHLPSTRRRRALRCTFPTRGLTGMP